METIEQRLINMCVDNGMFESQARQVVELTKPEIEKSGRIAWDLPADEYPIDMYVVMFMYLKPVALKWRKTLMTKASNEAKHFFLWNHIADTGEDKETAFKELFGDLKVINDCFACVEASKRQGERFPNMYQTPHAPGKCYFCPINWGAKDCETLSSPYENYFNAYIVGDKERMMTAAVLILDLDWNPSPEDIDDDESN